MKKNNPSSIIYHPSSKRSFTLMELLIVIGLIAVIATVAIILFNPWAQIAKGQDSKRKTELTQLNKILEDWYNDKGCYPKPADICYDVPPPPTNVFGSGVGGNQPLESQTCHICGNESSSPPFSPYLSRLPCDPQHKQKQYLYEVTAAPGYTSSTLPANPDDAINPCPQWYRVYSSLSNQSDPSAKELGCQGGGCGTVPNYGYDYGVTSPNEKLIKTSSYYCFNSSSKCNNCGGTYEICKTKLACKKFNSYYPSNENCCLVHPSSFGC